MGIKPAERKPYLKIGDVARLVGVSPSVIRSWESLGLTRPHRTASKYRLYAPEDVKLLKRARFLRKVRGTERARHRATFEARRPAAAFVKRGLQRDRHPPSPVACPPRAFPGAGSESGGHLPGFSERLERSQMSASVSTLRKLARFYKTNILDFFDPAESNIRLVSPDKRKVLEAGPGVRMELLAWGNTVMEPHLFRIAASFRQRRVLPPRRRGIPVHPAGRTGDFPGRRGVPSPTGRQFLFRECHAP